jgi:CO/xanthine dehydrogenase FAD-binding subunit
VKPAAFSYFAPTSTDEAIKLLATDDQARALAGGQSLVPMMNLRLARPPVLVDLNRIAELQSITENDKGLVIGAMTRQSHLLQSKIVVRRAPLIAEALSFVGHPPTRARGTIGGSISNADPAAELPAVMLALDAEMVLRGQAGERRVMADEFFIGMFETALQSGELLTAVHVPSAQPGDVSAFAEVTRRHGDFAIVSFAARLSFESGLTCSSARMVLGGIAPAPIRSIALEDLVSGNELSDHIISEAAYAIDEEVVEMDSHGASSAYRLNAARVLVRRTLEVLRRRRGAQS